MRNKGIIALVCVLLAGFLLGITGNVKIHNENADKLKTEDRFIGLFIAYKSLDLTGDGAFELVKAASFPKEYKELEGKLNDEKNQSILGSKSRIYARLENREAIDEKTGEKHLSKEYVFDVEGIRYFACNIKDGNNSCFSTIQDSQISDSIVKYNMGKDAEIQIELDGKIYASNNAKAEGLYIYSVFQSKEGEVYIAGNVFMMDLDFGMQNIKISDKKEREENGDKKTDYSFSAGIELVKMDIPQKLRVLQFSNKNELIKSDEYEQGRLPEKIEPISNAAYLLVESFSDMEGKNEPIRELYSKNENKFSSFICLENGICVKQSIGLEWQK